MIGIYHGHEKPKNVNEFLNDFVHEAIHVINNGILINEQLYRIQIKTFVCDAPAKSFIKCVKGHTGYHSCTKCYSEGDFIHSKMCFPNIENIRLRSDTDFRLKIEEDHHTGFSILENIPGVNMIVSFPLDYMHLVCLGVVKKLLCLWRTGKPSTKISNSKLSNTSNSLIHLAKSIPVEFIRKPRALDKVKRWKATEFRQFLFYTDDYFKARLKAKTTEDTNDLQSENDDSRKKGKQKKKWVSSVSLDSDETVIGSLPSSPIIKKKKTISMYRVSQNYMS
ncbi:uncharacterized protein LOC143187657 [Calliopsis andreniformis]|uniref:uncharacterized protein LOC143187657 n=1 Tax=Calliopsis andreniformis TaxID=337506 RepID=UPI003FCC7D1C